MIATAKAKADVAFATRVATAIGGLIREQGRAETAEKHDGTPVSDLDKRANNLFHSLVMTEAPNPGDLALGEEDLNPDRDIPPGVRLWVCDPVDGTWLLPCGLPYTVVSVALVVDGQPEVGVVYDPHNGRLFTAATYSTGGTFLRRSLDSHGKIAVEQVRANSHASLRGAVLALPGGAVPGLDVADMHAMAIRRGAELVTVGSVVHDATLVAAGFAAGMVFPYTKPWDMAAIAVIVREAGGTVTDLDGNDQRYDRDLNGAVVSNGVIHGELLNLVARSRP